ncbi:MAG: zinc ribbon domain-containing protein [Firmicutes bacterium]|nr:zinc ribbon domain-containing protein [Bacillota bacterium]
MPFFDFKCDSCGHRFTVRVSNQEKEKVTCPECGASHPRQIFTPFAIGGKSGSVAGPSESCSGCNQRGGFG